MADENTAAEGTEVEEAPKKSKLPLIIGAVVVLAGGGGAAFMFMSPKPAEAEAAPGPALPTDKLGKLMPLESFIVNLNEAKSTRYLKITFSVELADESVQEVVDERLPLIRDRVLTYLSGLSVDDVRGEAPKETVRETLIMRVNEALNMDGGVRSVLFTDFVVQ